MYVVTVQLPDDFYEVHIDRGLLGALGSQLRNLALDGRCAIVTDSNAAPLYLDRVAASLRAAGHDPIAVVLPAGESEKSLTRVEQVYDELLAARVDRSTAVLGLGGGVVTDLAGFAAATLLRGLPYIPVPTSLLAMVDAGIGGKTGVNHAAGKNLIGAFHQPRAVLIDPDVLATLPRRELRNGLAEVIKHYVIRDADGFARLESRMADALRPDVTFLTDVIAENVAIKARVVAADPYERGDRAHLNFGHTFGHAFESATNFALPHGEAVALGMCAAMHAAVEMGMVDSATKLRVADLIAAAGLPTRTNRVDGAVALAAMGTDKKRAGGRLRFVLAECIGRVVVRDDVPQNVVRKAIDSVCA